MWWATRRTGWTPSTATCRCSATLRGRFLTTAWEVFDHGSVSGQQYALGTTALQRRGAGAITFTNLNEVGVLAGAGADQVTAASLPPIPTFDFDLGAGMDRVRGPDAAETVWGVGIGRLTLDDMLIFVHADEVVGGSGTNASSSATVRS